MTEERFIKAYDAYADAIFRYFYFRVNDRERAKDMTQETFMKTWQYVTEGKTILNIRAFLYQVARNLIVDHSRKKTMLSLDELATKGFDPGVDERPLLQIGLDAHRALQVLDRLDESYREVVVMRYVDGYSPREIADELDESVNVVSVRIHRALKQLRKLLEVDEA